MTKLKVFIYIILLAFFLMSTTSKSQVQLRDTILNWQHHRFELNDDHSLNSYSTVDNDIQEIQFNAKVIENELIRMVVVPDYGARVLSFVYKPTGHEYLYQSECGTPFGINEGSFYYNWLIVYGGIFPTFPEPEHGKTWLLPWKYDVVKEIKDTVIIRMEFTDTTFYSNAPSKFNNGITNITCRIEVGVYKESSLWDFNVSLKNNNDEDVSYEYWTCTTLTPGSDIGNTGSPLNSEIVVPIEKYKASWSPGSWIGNYGSLYDFTEINYLSEWENNGIAYAHDLTDNYWGVINHENKEGIFRISENIETPGMKFWTWGKNNIDNDLFDFSNGGKDNYIELWAGVSKEFFSDATLPTQGEIRWNESYCPTVNLTGISKINKSLAVNLGWDQVESELSYELFAFKPNLEYRVKIDLIGENNYSVVDEVIIADVLGNNEDYILDYISPGDYIVNFNVNDRDDKLILTSKKEISVINTNVESERSHDNSITVKQLGERKVNISFAEFENYRLQIFNINGQLVLNKEFHGTSIDLTLPTAGAFIINVNGERSNFTDKILVY